MAYLMNGQGTTIATSNRSAADSFLGKDYSFRPYFTEAISGKSSAYMALGVTSGRRGIYLAHPAIDGDGGSIRGVAVLKMSIDDFEKRLPADEEDVIVVTDPHGVIFMSSSPDLLYKTLWRLEPEEIVALVKTEQFGKQTLAWSGMRRDGPTRVLGPRGEVYEDQEAELAGLPGWHLVYLDQLHVLPTDIMSSLARLSGILFLGVFPGLGIIVLVLYRTASREIADRLESDEERELLVAQQQEAAANIKTLTGLLPICAGCKKIRDDQNRWSPVEVYVSAHTTAQFSHGMCPDCMKAYYPDFHIDPGPGEKT